MNQNPLQEITQKLAGHIRQPMGAHQIAKELEAAEYSSELIIQHLILLLDHGVCGWEENEDGWWNTDCGNAFEFTDGSPIYNEFNHCPYCGKTLTETPYSDDDSPPNIQVDPFAKRTLSPTPCYTSDPEVKSEADQIRQKILQGVSALEEVALRQRLKRLEVNTTTQGGR